MLFISDLLKTFEVSCIIAHTSKDHHSSMFYLFTRGGSNIMGGSKEATLHLRLLRSYIVDQYY